MAPSPFAVLLLSALSFQPGSPESNNLVGGRPSGIPKRGSERRLGVAATCDHGSEVCEVDGSWWSKDTIANFAGRLPGDLRELRLDLFRSELDDACLGTLAARLPGCLQHLELDLHDTKVGDRGLERLVEALPASLQHLGLQLWRTNVGDRSLERLAEALPASLQHLGLVLDGTNVSDRGLERLTEALPASLQHLGLYLINTKVGDRGLEGLAALPTSLQHLELALEGTSVGDRGLERLAEALPQQHLEDLELNIHRFGKVSLHSAEALFKKLPAGLQRLSLDRRSCNGWHRAVETMHLSNKSPSDVWPQFSSAMDGSKSLCAVMFVLLAGTPDLKDTSTGMTALMLATKSRDLEVVRYLIRLGADVLDMDRQGRTARDFASTMKLPAFLDAMPKAPSSRVLVHMTQQLRFWIVTAACLVVAVVACAPLQFWDTAAGSVEDGLTGGPVRLAAKATHSKAMVMFASTTRLLEVISNLTGITMLMHRVKPAFALPVCLMLYGLPRLLRPRRGALEAPLGVELAVMHTSLLDAASSRRNTAHGATFAVARLTLLFLLASFSSLFPEWMLNGTIRTALFSLTSNRRMGVCLDGVAPPLRFAGWRPWNVLVTDDTDDSGPGRNAGKPDGCIHVSGRSPVQSSLLTSRIATLNWTSGMDVLIDGSVIYSADDAVGAVPIGEWIFLQEKLGSTAVVCPDSSACLATPRVHELWSLLTKACQAAVLLWAVAALAACALRARGTSGSRQRRAEVFALARRIAAAGSAEEVGELRGAAAPVQPAKALVLCPPGGIYFTLLLVFADVFLDGYTIYTMISNQDIYFAGVLLATSLFSTIREVRRGALGSLRGWVAETLRTGIVADGLQSLLDNERGSEALISLLVSSYALPFTIKSPTDALLCPLSVLSSAKGLSSFLHEYLDLSLEEPEDEEESEGTKDTESGEQSSDSSCTSSGSE